MNPSGADMNIGAGLGRQRGRRTDAGNGGRHRHAAQGADASSGAWRIEKIYSRNSNIRNNNIRYQKYKKRTRVTKTLPTPNPTTTVTTITTMGTPKTDDQYPAPHNTHRHINRYQGTGTGAGKGKKTFQNITTTTTIDTGTTTCPPKIKTKPQTIGYRKLPIGSPNATTTRNI